MVFVPKCRRRTLYGQLRRHLGEVFHALTRQRESRIEEGHLVPDHVHMLISIPPEYAVSQVVGYIKGKSAIHVARVYGERKRNFRPQGLGQGLRVAPGAQTRTRYLDPAPARFEPAQQAPIERLFGVNEELSQRNRGQQA